MARRVKLHVREGVAMITLAPLEGGAVRSGAHGFDPETRAALSGALDLALADPAAQAILLRAGPEGWPAACPDPATDYHAVPGVPGLGALCARIAAAPKPVVALLSGEIRGGGLALAQAAGWRIAAPQVRICAPETQLGLLPGGGALVRMARRAGAKAALDLALGGVDGPEIWSAARAQAAGLIDGVIEGAGADEAGTIDAAGFALACALARAPAAGPARRGADAGLEDPAGWLAAVAARRAALRAGPGGAVPPAVAARVVEVVEAALLLAQEGALEFEAAALGEMIDGPLARALRHVAAADAGARVFPGIGTAGAGFARVGLWHTGGAGLVRLARLALRLAEAAQVRLGAQSAAETEELFAAAARAQEAAIDAGHLDRAAADAIWDRIVPVVTPETAGEADLLVVSGEGSAAPLRGAAPGRPRLWLERSVAGWWLLRAGPRVGELCPPADIGAEPDPQDTAGPPEGAAPARRLLATLQTGGYLIVRGGRGPARAPGAGPEGGIAAHLQAGLLRAAERLALAGADPAQIDRALEAAGFGEGPFRRLDRAGQAAALRLFAQTDRGPGPLLATWAGGWHGGGAALAAHLAGLRAAAAADGSAPPCLAAPRPDAREIVAATLAEIAGEGAYLLETGRAFRGTDVDLVAIEDCGIEARTGGPLHMADLAGPQRLRDRLRGLAAAGGRPPVALWDDLIANGRRFAQIGAEAP